MSTGPTVTLAQLKEMIGDLHISWELAKARVVEREQTITAMEQQIAGLFSKIDAMEVEITLLKTTPARPAKGAKESRISGR